jgi:hypothetical protein
MVITLFVILIVWIFYKFNIPVPIPRLNIRLPEQKRLEIREKAISATLAKQTKKTSDRGDYNNNQIDSDNQ